MSAVSEHLRTAPAARASRTGRGTTTAAISAAVALALLVAGFTLGPSLRRPARIALYLDGVAVAGNGRLVAVPAGSRADYLPGTRVIDPRATERAAADRAWLATGRVPGEDGPYGDMVAGALLDLRALVSDDGALIAAHSPNWRYVWPRDASFGAAALATTGHTADARRILLHLQHLVTVSGRFEARYRPDGSGAVPDDRPPQSDGAGWVLWATDRYLDALPESSRSAAAEELEPLVDTARTFIAGQLDTPTGLPRRSGDYWETPTAAVTLGTAAPALAGLESAAAIYGVLGRHRDAQRARDAADSLHSVLSSTFGRQGYPRLLGNGRRDAATAFLLPPFQPAALEGAQEAWAASIPDMARPAGGLAPGGSWRKDGVSWTPQTALYALAAATNGDRDRAEGWLDFLEGHRTASGALPEKVLHDGSPAAVAPLAWTCALVVLAVESLEADPGASAQGW